MASLTDLHRSVQATLASKRLGTPVFVRYLLQSHNKSAAVMPRLAWLTGIIRDWIDQPLERIYAQGQAKNGHLDLTLEFRNGASAVLHWTVAAGSLFTADVMILGNHGALYQEGQEPLVISAAARPEAELLAFVERAVRSGRPEAAEK